MKLYEFNKELIECCMVQGMESICAKCVQQKEQALEPFEASVAASFLHGYCTE